MRKKLFVALLCVLLTVSAFACTHDKPDPVTLGTPTNGTMSLTGENKLNTDVTVTAAANEGYVFRYITVNDVKVYNDTYTFTVKQPTTVNAVFVAEADLKVKTAAMGNGSVTRVFISEDGKEKLRLNATPDENNKFVGWYGPDGRISKDSLISVVYNENAPTEVTAKFVYSPMAGIMRVIAAGANNYALFPQTAAEWNDFYFDVGLEYAELGSVTENRYALSAKGLWETYNRDAAGTLLPWTHTTFSVKVTDQQTKGEVFELYLADNRVENELSKLYIGMGGTKKCFDFLPMTLIREFIESRPDNAAAGTHNTPESAAAFGEDGDVLEMIDEMLISQNWVEAAEDGDKISLTVNLGEILRTVDAETLTLIGQLAQIDLGDVIKFFEENAEFLEKLPDIALNIIAVVTDGEEPLLKSVELGLTIDGFTADETQVGSWNGALAINAATFTNCASPSMKKTYYDQLILLKPTGYNETGDTLDLSLQGYADLSHSASESVPTRIYYDIYVQLNPATFIKALSPAGFDSKKLDLNKLGFVSLRAYEKSGEVETDRLNVLYDSDNLGETDKNLMVYLKLDRPISNVDDTDELSFNANLAQLVAELPEYIDKIKDLINPLAPDPAALAATLAEMPDAKEFLIAALLEYVKPLIFKTHEVEIDGVQIDLDLSLNDKGEISLLTTKLLPLLYDNMVFAADIFEVDLFSALFGKSAVTENETTVMKPNDTLNIVLYNNNIFTTPEDIRAKSYTAFQKRHPQVLERGDTADLQLSGSVDFSNSLSNDAPLRVYYDVYAEIEFKTVLAAIDGGALDIAKLDWDNLGFINLRLYEKDETGTETDYINLLYDDNGLAGTEKNLACYLKFRHPVIELLSLLTPYDEISFSAKLSELVTDIPDFIDRVQLLISSLNPTPDPEPTPDPAITAGVEEFAVAAIVELLQPAVEKDYKLTIGDSEINLNVGIGADNNLTLRSADLLPFLYGKLFIPVKISEDAKLDVDLFSAFFGKSNVVENGETVLKPNDTLAMVLSVARLGTPSGIRKESLRIFDSQHPVVLEITDLKLITDFDDTNYTDHVADEPINNSSMTQAELDAFIESCNAGPNNSFFLIGKTTSGVEGLIPNEIWAAFGASYEMVGGKAVVTVTLQQAYDGTDVTITGLISTLLSMFDQSVEPGGSKINPLPINSYTMSFNVNIVEEEPPAVTPAA